MILLDINYFKTKNIIKEDDCSCDESIEFLTKTYGTGDMDATKIYDDVMNNPKSPARWKKDTLLYRNTYKGLKAYVDLYNRSKIVETNIYRYVAGDQVIVSGTMQQCADKLEEIANLEYNKIQNPLEIVTVKIETNPDGKKTYTFDKYENIDQIPNDVPVQVVTYDGIDKIQVSDKRQISKAQQEAKRKILDRIKGMYVLERRYTDETNWFNGWNKV